MTELDPRAGAAAPHGGPTGSVLSAATVDDAVLALRPDYRALLVVVSGVRGGPTDAGSDEALSRAERSAVARLAGRPPEALAEVAAWREAFAGFGVKPRVARSSVEALLRRVEAGLPRVDRLTDLYNAVSVEHLVPVGGEDLDRYVGPPRLVRAFGDEPFDTVADGVAVTVPVDAGEVVWRDDAGVTCRRWNWRQCVRTRLSPGTGRMLVIVDALDPVGDDVLVGIGQELITRLTADAPEAEVSTRLLGGG